MRLTEVSTPALCVDLDAFERNIATMASFFATRPCALRPHFKAHKTVDIARRQAEAGCEGFCCATLGEAEVLADAGFDDVLIANQVVDPTKRDRLRDLAARIDLTVAVDSASGIELLRGSSASVLVDVNVGMPRCGVPRDRVVDLARRCADADLRVRGVMGYEGHVVSVADRTERTRAAQTAMEVLLAAADDLRSAAFDIDVVSAGGTGTFDITGAIDGITEIQAGSYALMDTDYAKLGLPFEEALRCLTTVVSVQDGIGVLDAGLKTLAVDHGPPKIEEGLPAQVFFLSDEHTTLILDDPDRFTPGERVWLRPSHVDPTVNLHDTLYAFRGTEIIETWPVSARGYERR